LPDRPGPDRDTEAVFDALADPTRRRLLRQLAADGPLTATELAADYPISRQAVVKHLATLGAAGLLEAERSGREVRYRVRPAPLDGAAAWLDDVGRRWDRRLAALEDRVRRRATPP
jgi:DNA-binding transcriptional ArsR family regulator